MNEFVYEVVLSESGFKSIKRTDETASVTIIPADENNSDYIAYLASLETPLSDTE